MKSAVTVSLVSEARGGPFVFWDDLPAACQKATALGFDAVEIFPRSPEQLEVPKLRQLLAASKLKLAGMGTGAGWVVHKLRLTDPDPKVRQRAQEFAGGIVDVAGQLGASAIVGSMQGRWEGAVSREQALTWLGEGLVALGQRAERYGLPLLFEPLNRYETNLLNRTDETLSFLDGLGRSNVKLLCDLFHMNIEEVSLENALRQAGAKLGHLHFADSNRRAIGFGHTNLQAVRRALHELHYEGYISAEVLPWPGSDEAAAQTMKAYRELTGAD